MDQVKTYQIDPLPTMAARDIVGGLNQALQAWSDVAPLTFVQRPTDADIRFRFDGQTTKPDGTVQPIPVFATALAEFGQISFSTAHVYSSLPATIAGGAEDIVALALHEIGHILGLGHSANQEAVMYPHGNPRVLSADDIEGIQRLYGARPHAVPGWFGAHAAGADIAVADFHQGTVPQTDLVVGHIDNPDGADRAYYRVGWNLDWNGVPRSGWSPITEMGAPLGHECQGMALALGFIGPLTPGGISLLDTIFVRMDNPAGENRALYRVGFNLDRSGLNRRWTRDLEIPGPWGHETAGLAAAIHDVSRSGRPDLIVAWIDSPDGANKIHYKIGFDIDSGGHVTQWSPRMEVDGWVGERSGGLGISVTDERGNGRPDMVVFWVDDPDDDNRGYVRVGRDLDPTGTPLGGWDDMRPVPAWWGASTTGAGAALAGLRGLARQDLIVLHLDAAEGGTQAFYRVLSPPLPTWSAIRQLGSMIGTRRLAAVSPAPLPNADASDVVVVGARIAGSQIALATWDQTDLDENVGSDVVQFAMPTVGTASVDSPLALASRIPTQVDAFWIGTDDLVRTTWATVGQPGSAATGPLWARPPLQPVGAVPARAASAPGLPVVPPSPIAAASIGEQHIAVFVISREDEIVAQSWTQAASWTPPRFQREPWQRPLTALTAAARDGRVWLYWVDGVGAIWQSSVDAQSAFGEAALIWPAGNVDSRSNLVAVSRNANQMDLFWIAPDGRIQSSGWTGGSWSAPFEIGSGRRAGLPGTLAAVHVGNQHMQAFWEEPTRSIWTTWWGPRPDDAPVPWSPPVEAVPVGATLGGADLVAAARGAGHVRLFFIDNGGLVSETYWGTKP